MIKYLAKLQQTEHPILPQYKYEYTMKVVYRRQSGEHS